MEKIFKIAVPIVIGICVLVKILSVFLPDFFNSYIDNDIDIVKNGVLDIDETRTIEQALSSTMKNLEWEIFVGEDNGTTVEVKGIWKHGSFKKLVDTALKEQGIDAIKQHPLFGFYYSLTEKQINAGIALMSKFLPENGDIVMLQFDILANGEGCQFRYGEVRSADTKEIKKLVIKGKTVAEARTSHAFFAHISEEMDAPDFFLEYVYGL